MRQKKIEALIADAEQTEAQIKALSDSGFDNPQGLKTLRHSYNGLMKEIESVQAGRDRWADRNSN